MSLSVYSIFCFTTSTCLYLSRLSLCVEKWWGCQCQSRLYRSHDRAVLLYEYVGKKTVDLQHTEVPDAYRGRGIAKHLAKAAMDFVVEEDLKAHLTCWYIQKYVKENPQPQYFEHIYQ
uniref:Protein NATD1 n=1 Tax=Sphaeramia orbicularis TaxID=375764 RepID=A0A672YIJ5_9TELE